MSAPGNTAAEILRNGVDLALTDLGRIDPELARHYQDMVESLDFAGELTTSRATLIGLAVGATTNALRQGPVGAGGR